MTSESYRIVDRVTRETAELLEGTDAILAWGDEDVYVLEPREATES